MSCKTIYFPADISGTGKAERLSISLNRLPAKSSFRKWLIRQKAEYIRCSLKLSFNDLKEIARDSFSSISTTALEILKREFDEGDSAYRSGQQLELFYEKGDARQKGKNGTFSNSKAKPISRWYPYLEGYSEDFVLSFIDELKPNIKGRMFDPFCGSGTTALAAISYGWDSIYCEINPFMRNVIYAKTSLAKYIHTNAIDIVQCAEHVVRATRSKLLELNICSKIISDCFPGRPYFQSKQLQEFVSLRQNLISETRKVDERVQGMMRFALACIAINVSNLKRAGDVRYRRPSEQVPEDLCVFSEFLAKIHEIATDIPLLSSSYLKKPSLLSQSCMEIPFVDLERETESVDLIVTSPPYLNGTNYIRNTKLELWALGLIKAEKDLSPLRRSAVTAGINDVFRDNRFREEPKWSRLTTASLDKVTYDRRIPLMVRSYASDLLKWTRSCHTLLKANSEMVIDIGDSIFAGVHVPTIDWMSDACREVGLDTVEVREVRKRKSKNGDELKQSVVIVRKKHSSGRQVKAKVHKSIDIHTVSKAFSINLPYKTQPYSSRNWGNNLHSLCSYQGKLKPALAHFLIKEFTQKGDRVLDPLSGAGTIPLECTLQYRVPVSNDLQELAHTLSIVKSGVGDISTVYQELERLLSFISQSSNDFNQQSYSNFGFNGKLPEYFHPKTFREILCAREYFKCNLREQSYPWHMAVVAACWLHILHGNRPYSLSRRSHPVTPFKPTGPFEYRAIDSRLRDKVDRTVRAFSEIERKLDPESYLGNFEDLTITHQVDAVITSPPFANSTRFYVANWLRLWASGWEPSDFKERPLLFIETAQKKSYSIYEIFLDRCRKWCKPGAPIIMHLGRTKKTSMADEIERIAIRNDFKIISKFGECVASCEKFGVRDQGATVAHEFLIIEA